MESRGRLLPKHQSTTKAFAVHQTLAPLSYRLSKPEAPPTCGRSTWLLYTSLPFGGFWLQTSHRIVPPIEFTAHFRGRGIRMEAHISLRPAHGIANAIAMSVPFWVVVVEVVWMLT